jgi:two-component system sensor histidine kinase YesM
MKTVRQKISDLSIKKKIIFYSYLVVTPVLLLISGTLFWRNYTQMSGSQKEVALSSIKSLDDSFSGLCDNMVNLSTYLGINNDVLSILRSTDGASLNKDSRLWLNNAPVEFIQDTLALRGYIKTLGIYPENGVKPYLRCLDSSSYVTDMAQIRTTEVYQRALENKGKVQWQRVEKYAGDTYQANRNDKIVMYREIYDLTKKQALGYVVIGADLSKFMELCTNAVRQDNEGILVLNTQGEELFSYGEVDDKSRAYLTSEKFIGRQFEQDQQSFGYGGANICWSNKSDKGFIVCGISPSGSVAAQVISIAYTPLVLLVGVLLGLLPVLLLISNIIIRPLGHVCAAMGKFRQGDFSQQVEVESGDEVGQLADGFNKMVKDIKSLIDEKYVIELKEKESELTALQAQINPHFLYNTLDVLYWQAQDAGNEDISENILALSNLFRMVLGEGKGVTRVRDEKRLIEEYLKIQKMRFSRRMEYTIRIEDEILDQMIPKLILQPFVENAIVHGFENTNTSCHLYVEGKKLENGIRFCIQDTGVGMSREQIKAIFEVDDAERYRGQRIGRYAVKNVKERLELMYHDRFELGMDSVIGRGTTVTLTIWDDNTYNTRGKESEITDCR